MDVHRLLKIVSGGQTGVDRAALDAAMFLEIPHGGWCPLGRRAEDGVIPKIYQLREMPKRDYAKRTEQNVIDSDGTLILYRNRLSGGTELTFRLTKKHQRPVLCIDLNFADPVDITNDKNRQVFVEFLAASNIQVLNVAGPRETSSPGITTLAERFLVFALQ